MEEPPSLSSSAYNIHQDIDVQEKSILLQRSASRVKQVEFELAVSQQVTIALKQQVHEANEKLNSLQSQVNGSGSLQLKESGLKELLTVSQKKLRKQQRDGKYQGEQVSSLTSELKKSRMRLRELELERACLMEKMDDCLTMLSATSEKDQVVRDLQQKVLKMPVLLKTIASLRGQLEDCQQEMRELKEASKINENMVTEMTKLLTPELSNKEINDTIECLKQGRELSTEQAQLLTITHLKSQVEKLEDEKTLFRERIASLNQQVEEASLADGGNPISKPIGGRSSLASFRSMLSSTTLGKKL